MKREGATVLQTIITGSMPKSIEALGRILFQQNHDYEETISHLQPTLIPTVDVNTLN